MAPTWLPLFTLSSFLFQRQNERKREKRSDKSDIDVKHLGHLADTIARSMFSTIRIFQLRATFCVSDKRTVRNIQLYSILLGFTLQKSRIRTPWIWSILHYGLWARDFRYGLCACQNTQTIMQRKIMFRDCLAHALRQNFEWSSSLSMDVTRAELEIQESHH